MNAKDVLKNQIETAQMITRGYIEDLQDEELLVRTVPNANHIAWQLGHMLASEHDMLAALGHQPPALPEGFAAAHTPETATSDDASRFFPQREYLRLLDEMKDASLAAVDSTPDADLDQPAPEIMQSYAPTIGAALAMLGPHRVMHAGQFVPIRRKLGKQPLF